MRIPRIYLDLELIVNTTVILTPEAHRHIVNVLRLKEKSPLILFNGNGNDYQASITSIEKKQTSIEILSEQCNPTSSPLNIELGLSLIKSDKFDFAIQKAVELGVASITPIAAMRSTVKLDVKREPKRLAHWQGIIQSACEQSGQSRLPTLNPVSSLSDWLACSALPGIAFEPTATHSLSSLKINDTIRVVIGPEGGFTDNELGEIKQQNFSVARLGPRILRAETAAVTALTSLQLLYGDLNI